MSPSRLLRTSAFCREKVPRKVPVKVEILNALPRRRRRIRPRIEDDEATAYVSADLLVALSVQVGDLAWLASSSTLSNGVPIVLLVDEERADINGAFVVRVPPTIAASVGFSYEINGSSSCWIQTNQTDVKEAETIKVRPLGRPVPPSWSDTPETVPNLTSSKIRLLAPSSLISVWDDCRGLFVFEVVDMKTNQGHAEAALATSKTKWALDAMPMGSAIRRLPPLAMAASFHASMRNPEDSDELSSERIHPPHPSTLDLRNALAIPANAPSSQRVLHVEGTEENHVGVCIETAANSLGMRYLPIRGLAAHAYASDIPVSTGSQTDQLRGCNAALRHAKECAPCVLHLCNIDQEWSQDDEPMRQMQQQRLWTVLMDSLGGRQDSEIPLHNLSAYAPTVIVVLSTTKPLSAGPLLHNMVFESATVGQPDEEYARFLWNDDPSFEELFSSHLQGRCARDISHLQRYWRHCTSASDRMEAFNTFCKKMDAKQRKSTPHIPTVQWQDVGGLSHVRDEIMDAIELPLKHPKLFPNGGRSGILLYGKW